MLESVLQTIAQWSIAHGIKILAILIVAWIVLKILKIIIHRFIKSIISTREKRAATLQGVFCSTAKIVIWLIATMMILPEFGINIGPILAAVGVVGLAFGFGAQYLIRDLIAGLFIILEDQYQKGDVIKIGNVSGKVEDINLRKTILRDEDGTVHYIPNGEIKIASNKTR